MRYLLVSITILLLLTGCTMHPPSTAAFMDATERSAKYPGESRQAFTVRGEYSQYAVKDDGWDFPASLEYLFSKNGLTWGAGLLPSPYFTAGFGDKYYGVRTWISAPWLIGTLSVIGLLSDDDDDEEYEDKDDRYDVDDLGDLPALWFVTFAGGVSFIQQLPLGEFVRIGIEEFIARDVWIPVRDNNEWSAIEAGLTAYISYRQSKFDIAIEGRYSILDMDPDRYRLGISLTASYFVF